MDTNHSSATPRFEYQPTIIESGLLIERLAIQIKFLNSEFKRNWGELRQNPLAFAARSTKELFCCLKELVMTPKTLSAGATAIIAVTCLVILGHFIGRNSFGIGPMPQDSSKSPLEVVLLDLRRPRDSGRDAIGKASGSTRKGGGGDRDPLPPQFGKLPPPSLIPAAIPKTPPINAPSLPVAGIDIDPTQWRDVKAPIYGDPESKSQTPSSGPGDGGGIGTGTGPGIGSGTESGYGCRSGADVSSRGFTGPLNASQVDQRARLIFKPEPQYTEEARRNQITGTVMLRVIFSSAGEVAQIRAVRTLPFGLTERAIAAARQIKFVPAMKGGQPVSVHMQLEYNFNLY